MDIQERIFGVPVEYGVSSVEISGQILGTNASSWVPVYVDREKKLGIMSIGFLAPNKLDAVILRGPRKTGKSLQSSRRGTVLTSRAGGPFPKSDHYAVRAGSVLGRDRLPHSRYSTRGWG